MNRRNNRGEVKGSWVLVGIAIAFLLIVTGFITVNWGGQAPIVPTPIPPPPAGYESATIQLQVVNAISKAGVTTSTTTADVSLAVNGVFDLLTQADTLTVASNPDTMATIYPEGAELIIRVGCVGNPTNGLDYYDGWYYVKLLEGTPIYKLSPSMLTVVSTSPSYTYTVSTVGAVTTGHTVSRTSASSTPYWDIGKLDMYPRIAAAGFDTYLTYASADLAKVTDGSTWVDTAAEITANATLASDDETFYFEMHAGNADLGWGWPLYVLSQKGEFKDYHAYLIMSTAMTAIGNSKLTDYGWVKINDGTLYTEVAYYYDVTANLGPQYPTKGSKLDLSIPIPIDATAATASTEYLFKLWAMDCQPQSDVSIGATTTSLPTAYGMITAYGPGALVQASAYTTSSGAGSGRILQVYLTTAA